MRAWRSSVAATTMDAPFLAGKKVIQPERGEQSALALTTRQHPARRTHRRRIQHRRPEGHLPRTQQQR
jgi:hypothetical protein